jgi:hypothetical protein
MLLLAACGGAGTPPAVSKSAGQDGVAEAYVRLVLAVGRHDPLYVDAYYGPPAWKTIADGGEPVPLPELLARTRTLLDDTRKADGPADRKRYLEKQLVAVEGHLRRLSGERMTLGEECRVLYDADPPRHDVAEFEAAHATLEKLVPGRGPLGPRIEAMRNAVHIPKDKVAAALAASLDAARTANAPFVTLPASESFQTVLVTGKPWGAYNWYLGNYRSRIELNTDLPTEANGLLGTMCHEGYPGHHVYNVLLEKALVRDRGWPEYQVYALFSPQSLIAEGTANYGIEVAFPPADRLAFEREVIFPAAGLDPAGAARYYEVMGLVDQLSYAGNEAARRYLDGEFDAKAAATWLERYGLYSPVRAQQRVRFIDQYRSYVINYNLGKDMVRRYIESQGGTADKPAERWKVFEKLLSSPRLPSSLK